MTEILLNHHSATVLPFYETPNDIYFILEQKDPRYKPPFFDKRLNFLGGNWKKGGNIDKSPIETVSREIREEFWCQHEDLESLNELLGQDFFKEEPEIRATYNQKALQKIIPIGKMFNESLEHVGDFKVTINPPIMDNRLVYGSTIFKKRLSRKEFKTIESVIEEFDGKLTTDTLKWESKILAISLNEINQENRKFSWAYDHTLNHFLDSQEKDYSKVIRPLSLVQIEEITPKNLRSFEELEKLGFKYSS